LCVPPSHTSPYHANQPKQPRKAVAPKRMHAMSPKTRRAMTGLETAIILVAFVITAAAFSFVVLNMGFLTSQKSQTVIASSIEESSTALLCDGDVVGRFNETTTELKEIIFYVRLTGSSKPIVMTSSRLAITYSNARQSGVLYGSLVTNGTVCTVTESSGDGDDTLEQGEMFKIRCAISSVEADADTGLTLTDAYAVKYESFRVTVRPSNGAVLAIERTIPGGVDEYMVLDK